MKTRVEIQCGLVGALERTSSESTEAVEGIGEEKKMTKGGEWEEWRVSLSGRGGVQISPGGKPDGGVTNLYITSLRGLVGHKLE